MSLHEKENIQDMLTMFSFVKK